MSREETIQLLMVVQAAYPNFKVQDKSVTVNTWYMMLEEYDNALIMASLKTFIATDTSGFAPSIGQVINKAHELMESQTKELTSAEAWSLVSKAIRNSAYNSKTEFDKLPDNVKKAVGSHEILKVWAMDSNYNEGVASSNFMRTYDSVVARGKADAKLPASVKNLISSGDILLLKGD